MVKIDTDIDTLYNEFVVNFPKSKNRNLLFNKIDRFSSTKASTEDFIFQKGFLRLSYNKK